MLAGAPPVDIRTPPVDFDALIDWFDRVSYRLVLLEEYPLADIQAAVGAVERGVRAHLGADRARGPPVGLPPPSSGATAEAATIRDDHVRYRSSLEQLRGLLEIVEREDHGGHRQVLGPYGRLLAESLRRHRREEAGAGPVGLRKS